MRLGLNLLFLLPGETGGRETYARELIAAMLQERPELRPTAFVNREAAAQLSRDLGADMPIVVLPNSPRDASSWAQGELITLPRAAARQGIELLHSPANFGPASGPFARVQTLHDLQYAEVPELVPLARRLPTAALIGAAAYRAHRVLTGAEAARQAIHRRLRIPLERIDVVHHGAGVPAQPPSDASVILERLGIAPGRPIVLAVSTNLPHKNLRRLIDAMGTLVSERSPSIPRPQLVLAGGATDSDILRAVVAASRAAADVHTLGRVSGEELEALYAGASCVAFPTLHEGFGLPVLEAMTRGVPVACSNIPVLVEVTGDAAELFEPLDPSDIAVQIARIIDNPELAARLVAAGHRRAAMFNWSRAARETLACYDRALAADLSARPEPR